MYIVLVQVHVKPGSIQPFIEATLENARNSLQEPGVLRFDFLQQKDTPERFLLFEAYRTLGDNAKHKETAHYPIWRDKVEDMMAEPRTSVKYDALYPLESEWER